VKLTTHPHLVPRSRIGGAVPPFPSTSSRRGAHLKHGDNFTLYQYLLDYKSENKEEDTENFAKFFGTGDQISFLTNSDQIKSRKLTFSLIRIPYRKFLLTFVGL
jgi:hypothetical protein